jgi:hypothetical protein
VCRPIRPGLHGHREDRGGHHHGTLPQPREPALVVSSDRPGILHGGPARIGGNRAEWFTAIRAGNADLTVPGSCPDLASTMPDPAAPCVVLRIT